MGRPLSRRSTLLGLAALAKMTRMSTARAAEKLRVGKSVAENWGNVPLNIGNNFDLFEHEGLEIEELVFAGGAKLVQALTAGEVDIGLSGGPDMAYIAKGAPEIAIATIADTAAFMGFNVGNQSTARTIDDLKGKKIGVTSAGSTTFWLVDELNRVKGWTDSDRAIPIVIGGSPTSGFAALKTGEIDAHVGGTSTGYQLEERHEGRLLVDCATFVPSISLYVIYASTMLTRTNPGAIRSFLKGWFGSVAFMRAHKAETIPLAAKVMGYTPGVAERMYDTLMSKFSTDGRFTPSALETLRASFVDLKVLPDASIDMSIFYTTEFLSQG